MNLLCNKRHFRIFALSLQAVTTTTKITPGIRSVRSFSLASATLQNHYHHRVATINTSSISTFKLPSSMSTSSTTNRCFATYSQSTPETDVATFTTLNELEIQQSPDQNARLLTKSQVLSRTIPPLTTTSHKGSSGRILVIGGSPKYTGAPYYAAMSSLRVGADLVSVECAQEATFAIKCYSPELMVEGVYDGALFDSLVKSEEEGDNEEAERQRQIDFEIQSMVDKVISAMERGIHAIVIGPGLGRCPMVMRAAALIVQGAKERQIPLVLDADALYMLSLEENRNILAFPKTSNVSSEDIGETNNPSPSWQSTIVLTPNIVEYKRLVNSIGEGSEQKFKESFPGVIIVKKGLVDEIECNVDLSMIGSVSASDGTISNKFQCRRMNCSEEGGLKRSGGIGDILSGTIAAFIAWNRIQNVSVPKKKSHTNINDNEMYDDLDNVILSCWMACCITKRATKQAFIRKKRSMTAPDILEEIGDVVDNITKHD